MKKKFLCLVLVAATAFSLVACGAKAEEGVVEPEAQVQDQSDEAKEPENECPLADGEYLAKFNTDSSMFHVNDTKDGFGELTVKDGQMTIHVILAGKGILNLFPGLAEDAAKEGAVLLEPFTATVTYPDGLSEEVFGFDIPVPYLDEEFDVALIGKKGTWYDHKVSVTDVTEGVAGMDVAALADGEYTANVTLAGGSGKATVESHATVKVENGAMTATIVWSSKNYDYMIVDGTKYLNESAEGEPSSFTIPVLAIGTEFDVIGDTVAMSEPHEIEYTLLFEIVE